MSIVQAIASGHRAEVCLIVVKNCQIVGLIFGRSHLNGSASWVQCGGAVNDDFFRNSFDYRWLRDARGEGRGDVNGFFVATPLIIRVSPLMS